MGSFLFSTMVLFAQAAEPAKDAPQQNQLFQLLIPFLLIGFLFYFLLLRPQQREQARRQALLAAVKKTDRVITTSGIYGVVVSVDPAADEVVLKVDEATNTKIRVTLNSIAQIRGDETSKDKDSDTTSSK